MLPGTHVAETIMASAHVQVHRQAGHIDASNLIKALHNTLRAGIRLNMDLFAELTWANGHRVESKARHMTAIAPRVKLCDKPFAFKGSSTDATTPNLLTWVPSSCRLSMTTLAGVGQHPILGVVRNEEWHA